MSVKHGVYGVIRALGLIGLCELRGQCDTRDGQCYVLLNRSGERAISDVIVCHRGSCVLDPQIPSHHLHDLCGWRIRVGGQPMRRDLWSTAWARKSNCGYRAWSWIFVIALIVFAIWLNYFSKSYSATGMFSSLPAGGKQGIDASQMNALCATRAGQALTSANSHAAATCNSAASDVSSQRVMLALFVVLLIIAGVGTWRRSMQFRAANGTAPQQKMPYAHGYQAYEPQTPQPPQGAREAQPTPDSRRREDHPGS